MNQPTLASPVRTAIEISIYLFLVFAITAWCLRLLFPFLSIMVWAMIIAVAFHPLFLKLESALGGRRKLAVTVFALAGMGMIIVPAWLFAGSLITSAAEFGQHLRAGEIVVPPANEMVKSWPMVGPALYEQWSAAATDLSQWLSDHHDAVEKLLGGLSERAASTAFGVLQFLASVAIAAVMLAKAPSATRQLELIGERLAGARGHEMLDLTTATIRSVAVGVLGIAVIQAIAGGIGMVVMGVPAAGVWALIILMLAIAQLPPLLVLLPVIIYVFATNDNTLANSAFAVWCLAVSFSDGVLKPLLLGRGVDVPMIVILLGAIGGMLYSGIIGLFVGAVILALGYKLFQAWLGEDEAKISEAAQASGT